MGREERKIKKHLQQHEQDEVRKLAKKKKAGGKRVPEVSDATASGLVIETGAGRCVVRTEGSDLKCRSRLDIAVGDRVMYSPERRQVEKILPRATVLSRPDPHNPRLERVIAANIDIVANVVSLKSPPLSLGLIDRYLIAIEQSGAQPLICVNKIDLIEPGEDFASVLQPYAEIGVPVIQCSAARGIGLDPLRAALAGKLCVFTGHSGVGKSSLLNALNPEFEAVTGDVSASYNKGRHTTTGSKLYELANGAVIIDTPGIRELGLWNVSLAEVRHYFHEFDDFAQGCAFSDCTHTHEPRCAVKAAVEAGQIANVRYNSYLRISSSSDGDAEQQ